jgi:hypothetical protein
MLVTVQRLYHNLPASSTPHQPVYGYPHPPRSSLMNESLLDRKNAFSYTIEIADHPDQRTGVGSQNRHSANFLLYQEVDDRRHRRVSRDGHGIPGTLLSGVLAAARVVGMEVLKGVWATPSS